VEKGSPEHPTIEEASDAEAAIVAVAACPVARVDVIESPVE